MIRRSIGVLTCILLPLWGSHAQQKQQPKPHPPAPQVQEDPCKKPLDQGKIDEAIKKGCDYLLTTDPTVKQNPEYFVPAELVLLTLIHGGAFSEKNEMCRKLLDYVVNTKPIFTYRAAVKAMALSALDKGKYIEYIAQAGQFLVDTQLAEGDWGYGDPKRQHPSDAMTPKLRASSGNAKTTGVLIHLNPRSHAALKSNGDNSNTQYAALGLRACYDSGIEVPKETLELARQWWTQTQFADGGWTYVGRGTGLQDTSTDKKPKIQGKPVHTMTAGGVSSLAIYGYLLGELKKKEDFAKAPSIAAGIQWLGQDFQNTDRAKYWEYWAAFYLAYSIERAGILASFDNLGQHDWYKEGAHWLLSKQLENGSWKQNAPIFAIHDTCFAVLFLKKSTVALIDTGKKDVVPEKKPDKNKPIDSGQPDKK